MTIDSGASGLVRANNITTCSVAGIIHYYDNNICNTNIRNGNIKYT